MATQGFQLGRGGPGLSPEPLLFPGCRVAHRPEWVSSPAGEGRVSFEEVWSLIDIPVEELKGHLVA